MPSTHNSIPPALGLMESFDVDGVGGITTDLITAQVYPSASAIRSQLLREYGQHTHSRRIVESPLYEEPRLFAAGHSNQVVFNLSA
jgi:hypothetical protein